VEHLVVEDRREELLAPSLLALPLVADFDRLELSLF
jgi:hypothetical protein